VQEEYRWKPGFWAENREDFVWTPDCYTWTPRGYIFVRGFWDLPLENRGMLLAPLAVRAGAVGRVAPAVVIDVREALVHWFVGPTLRHYYFGDYYDLPRGPTQLYSWYDFAAAGSRVDPILAYYAAYNAPFFGTLKTKHKSFKADSKNRPALTWSSYANSGAGGLAFALSAQQLPAGIAPFTFAGDEFRAVTGYYHTAAVRRMEFEQGAFIGASRTPVFVGLDTFLPPGHGGLPPGLAKKGLVPPGFGGAPPGQVKKYVESFGPIVEKPGKGKGGGGGKGKGKGH